MMTPETKEAIEAAAPQAIVVLVLSWKNEVPRTELAQTSDRAERRRLLGEFFSRVKRPFLDEVTKQPDVHVTNSLDGTNQAIVEGPAHVWQCLIRKPGSILMSDRVEVTANTMSGYALH